MQVRFSAIQITNASYRPDNARAFGKDPQYGIYTAYTRPANNCPGQTLKAGLPNTKPVDLQFSEDLTRVLEDSSGGQYPGLIQDIRTVNFIFPSIDTDAKQITTPEAIKRKTGVFKLFLKSRKGST